MVTFLRSMVVCFSANLLRLPILNHFSISILNVLHIVDIIFSFKFKVKIQFKFQDMNVLKLCTCSVQNLTIHANWISFFCHVFNSSFFLLRFQLKQYFYFVLFPIYILDPISSNPRSPLEIIENYFLAAFLLSEEENPNRFIN